MFTEDDKAYIIAALVDRLGQEGSPRAALAAPFDNTTLPARLITAGTVFQYTVNAVQLCIEDGWDHNPTWMETLLINFGLLDLDARVKTIWERSKTKPVTDDPYRLTLLNNVTPFINRKPLRDHMQRLATPVSNGQPILVVTGKDKSGKSYSTTYINHFSNLNNKVIACSASLSDEVGLDLTAEKLARDLVSQMGQSLHDIPGPDTNMVSYTESLANWVLNRGCQLDGINCWFVLDNFKGNQLHESTKLFLKALSFKITKGIYPKKCRLILIGTDRGTLSAEPGAVDEENILECNRQEIEITVKEIASKSIRQPMNITAITDFLLEGLSARADKMAILNERLRSLLYAIKRLNTILLARPANEYEPVLIETLRDLPEGDDREAELDDTLNELNERISN